MGYIIGGFLRRNLRLIVKLIALMILFFALVVWLYFAYSPAILTSAHPVMVEEESARLSSLGSFLSALFQGNLGYSLYTPKPVWSDLMARLGTTVTLIVLSTVISIATGVIFAFIALKIEPKSRKPLSFAHSQKGFFFGLTVMTGVVLIFLFSYSLGWFPLGHTIPADWLIYPPENIFVEIAGRLRHLALPAFTLTLIFMVRSFFIVWSGGSPFTSKKTLKRLLLPFTTTDFACIISAVVLVEWTFILPGVGFLLLQSIEVFDYTMVVGAFIVLLAIAVILGYISVLLDFVQQRFGLGEDLNRKVAAKSGTKKIFLQSGKYTLLKHVVKQVLERKSLLIGSVIFFFLVIAAFAPLITPYDSVRIPFHPTYPPIAAHFAKPVWYRYLPGAEPVSENLQAVQQPGFNTATSLEELNFTTSLTQVISDQFVSDIGYEEDGCVAIVFEREEAEAPFGQVKASLFKEFDFPYEVPPERFVGQMALMVKASENVPITIVVAIEKEGSERRLEWWNQTFDTGGTKWVLLDPIVDSYAPKSWLRDRFGIEWVEDPASKMFSEPSNYRYGLEITFNETQHPRGEKVEATVYVDDFEFKLFGTAFGMLGTDQHGRDIFTQVLYGARTMLITTVPIAAVAALIGLGLGFLAGYFQNWADNLVMVFAETTLATPVFPLLIVFGFIYWHQGISWFLVLLWPLCTLATMASRKVYLFRPKNHKLSGNTIRSRFLNIFKDFSANFCLVMVSVTLLNLAISTSFIGIHESTATWSGIFDSAQSTARGIEFWWWWVPPIACIILFAVGFLLIGIGLDERLQPFKED
jgi:peptide/nickel transport system permease protein